MKLVKAIIRPSKLDEVTEALTAAGVQGITVVTVHGFGRQKGHKTVYRGQEYLVHFIEKKMIEITTNDEDAERIAKIIIKYARTGEVGDGKIFISSIDNAIRIRTGEEGEKAV
ncbi:MAG: P-II family nitrogen regulator [bacterium]